MNGQVQPPTEPLALLRHDLGAPAGEILADCEPLLAGVRATGRVADIAGLEKIQSAARRLRELINARLTVENLSGLVSPAAPARTVAHLRASTPLGDGRGETGYFSRFNGHILVADDKEENRAMLSRRLQRQGMKVSTAVNGREALELVRSQPFDDVRRHEQLDSTVAEILQRNYV